MEKYALLARLEAKPEKKRKLPHFKKSITTSLDEPETVNWYGWQIGTSTFEFFDTLKQKREESTS
jgi:hypothetical protein